MIEALLKQSKDKVCKKHLQYFIENIYRTDNKPSFYRFHQTADWCVAEFRKMGLKSRKIEFLADGKKTYGDWVMPKAWDAFSLQLKDSQTGKIIADYETISTHMVMGSGATPKGGVTGECIYIDNLSELSKYQVKDKFILTKENPQCFKKVAKEAGALAFLFHGKLESFQGDAVRWVNAWADRSDLWALTAADTEFPAISLSPNTVEYYKQKISSGEKIVFFADIQTKFYEGTLPVVEAILEGDSKEEVFFTGHLFEQGANDNASGCAGMMEMARILSQKKNKRTIRFLFTSEIYGTLPYCFENQTAIKNCKISMNIDSIADVDRKDNKMHIYQNPDIKPSFVNLLLKEIIKQSKSENIFNFKKFILDDNLVADPQIGIPCALMAVCAFRWHTSLDTLDTIDYDLFHLTTSICLTFAEITSNDSEDAYKILQPLVKQYIKTFAENINSKFLSSDLQVYKQELIDEISNGFINNLNSYFGKIEKGIDFQKNENGPKRTYFGPPSYQNVNKDDLKILSMWSSSALMILFLCNGNRSEKRIIAYAAYLFGLEVDYIVEILDALKRNNYLYFS